MHIPLSYFQYWLKAVDSHSLHPPYIYQFYCEVVKSNKEYYCFKEIENLRKEILRDNTVINIKDYGSGSRSSKKKQRKVKNIATTGLSTPKFSQLLFRIADHLKPETILELGTSLGINTLYLASYSKDIKVFTFEGCPETASYAKKMFASLNKKNIEVVQGNIDDNLPVFLSGLDKIDLIYFDANHSYNPTISYFELSLQKAHEKSVFIFDDIHWSAEMERAWKTIKSHPKVVMTLDIFDAGLVFFDKNLNSEHYILEF